MPTILDNIVANKLAEIAHHKTKQSLDMLQNQVEPTQPGRFENALYIPHERPVIKLMLEIKPASPSQGLLTNNFTLAPLLKEYNRFASALSVLTDQKFFQGSLDLLSEVVQNTPHPVLRKDFIVDPYQIYEARLAGAEAVLLIVKILTDQQLRELHENSLALGMTPVIEIQNEIELNRALKLDPRVILLNNRNLETFAISFETTLALAPKIPENVIIISASGIETRKDIETLLPATACFLIGSTLMKLPPHQLPQKLNELINNENAG